MKKRPIVINLQAEILARVLQLGGKSMVADGIVTVEMPDGNVWDFTLPQVVQKGLSN